MHSYQASKIQADYVSQVDVYSLNEDREIFHPAPSIPIKSITIEDIEEFNSPPIQGDLPEEVDTASTSDVTSSTVVVCDVICSFSPMMNHTQDNNSSSLRCAVLNRITKLANDSLITRDKCSHYDYSVRNRTFQEVVIGAVVEPTPDMFHATAKYKDPPPQHDGLSKLEGLRSYTIARGGHPSYIILASKPSKSFFLGWLKSIEPAMAASYGWSMAVINLLVEHDLFVCTMNFLYYRQLAHNGLQFLVYPHVFITALHAHLIFHCPTIVSDWAGDTIHAYYASDVDLSKDKPIEHDEFFNILYGVVLSMFSMICLGELNGSSVKGLLLSGGYTFDLKLLSQFSSTCIVLTKSNGPHIVLCSSANSLSEDSLGKTPRFSVYSGELSVMDTHSSKPLITSGMYYVTILYDVVRKSPMMVSRVGENVLPWVLIPYARIIFQVSMAFHAKSNQNSQNVRILLTAQNEEHVMGFVDVASAHYSYNFGNNPIVKIYTRILEHVHRPEKYDSFESALQALSLLDSK